MAVAGAEAVAHVLDNGTDPVQCSEEHEKRWLVRFEQVVLSRPGPAADIGDLKMVGPAVADGQRALTTRDTVGDDLGHPGRQGYQIQSIPASRLADRNLLRDVVQETRTVVVGSESDKPRGLEFERPQKIMAAMTQALEVQLAGKLGHDLGSCFVVDGRALHSGRQLRGVWEVEVEDLRLAVFAERFQLAMEEPGHIRPLALEVESAVVLP